ncbi:MAG: thiol-disulfide oxidoreductase DCC family protein, partial [Methylococcales bacterium]
CSHSAQFILQHDRRRAFKLATAQSSAGRALLTDRGLNPEKLETFVLLKEGRTYVRSDAALEIAEELDWPWRMLGTLRIIPRLLRNPLYDVIARNRYRWFGKKDSCMTPTDDIKSRFVE